MSAFADSFAQSESNRPFDDDDSYAGYNSQPFNDSFATGDDVFESQPPIYGQFSPQENGEFGGSEGRISLSPSETEAEQGLGLIEWRRQNVILLEDKERREKEVLSQIIKEAEDYKVGFYKKRQFTCENNKTTNREKEKSSREKTPNMTWRITETSSLLSTLPPLLPFPSVSFMAVSRIRVSAPSWEILVPEDERALVELITPAKNQSLPPLSLNAYQTMTFLIGE